MLVLARRRCEAVMVGPPRGRNPVPKVTVLEMKRSSVKLGFEADKNGSVHRWEVWQRIHDHGPPDIRQTPYPRL